MKEKDLDVTKPHYIDRFEKKSIVHQSKGLKECTKAEVKPKTKRQQYASTLNQQKKDKRSQEVKKIKEQLLAMLKHCKEQQDIDLVLKQAAISKQKEEHRQIIEEIRQKMSMLKKKIYELYRHTCDNPKDKLCTLCHKREKVYHQQVVKFLAKDEESSEQLLVLKEKINHPKNDYKRSSARNHERRSQQSKYQLLDSPNERQQIPKYSLKKSKEERGSQRLSGFRINRKTDKIKTMRKRAPQNQDQYSDQQNKSPYFSKEGERKGKQKSSTFRLLDNNVQSSRYVNEVNNFQDEYKKNQSSKFVAEDEFERYKPKLSYRKSIIKLGSEQPSRESQNHGAQKSKFYDLNNDQKNKRTGNNEGGANESRDSKTLDKKGDNSEGFKLVRQKPKQKIGSYQRTKNLKKSQLFMDLSDLESSKNIEEQKVHREREEIQQLIREREKSTDNAQSKLSRYQRERLIYGYLKKELVKMGCVDEYSEAADYLYCSNSESQVSIDSQPGSRNYSIKDRKQSLLSKLNIFNQSVNFEDMKTKIQTVISQKQALGENLIEYSQMVVNNTKGRRDQKIVQKFLAQVLKINDLKRLLRKKFSKEIDWSPKMREMHQFYTYLEFNLQNFRMNLSKKTENNWKQLSLEGKGEEFNLDELKITEDLGHYQGLENTEITQFQHHKEIQCSMRYYGIEVKRLQQLQHFLYPPPEMPHLPPQKVVQKSLKQIKQCDIFECYDLLGEDM